MTSLSRQLKKLAAPQSSLLDHKKKKGSLLFSSSEAANYSRETFYKIGYSGFVELLEISSEFNKFKETLFSRSTIEFQRTIQTKEVITNLDRTIEEFLLLLSPYLQKHASLKALEWLIQRFLIHEMNVDTLMMCILPYYESILFARILQLVDIRRDSNPWKWLHKSQVKGLPITKQAIFLQWQSSVWFRNFISSYFLKMLKLYRDPHNLRIAISFFISTQIGGIISCEKVTEDHIASICQTLSQSFSSSNVELISGMLLLSGQLAIKANFANSFSELILSKVSRVMLPELAVNCTLCLLTVCHYQNIKEFSTKVLKNLEGNMPILQKISDLSNKKAVGCFIVPYVSGMLKHLCTSDSMSSETKIKKKIMALVCWIQTISLSQADASKVISIFMNTLFGYTDFLTKMKTPLDLSFIWKELERSHPEGADNANVPSLASLSIVDNFEMEVEEIDASNEEVAVYKQKEEVNIDDCLQKFSGRDIHQTVITSCLQLIKNVICLDEEKMFQCFWQITSDDEDDQFSSSLKTIIKVLSVVVACQMKNKHKAICEEILKEIFNKKLGKLKYQIRLLSVIWGWNSDIQIKIKVDMTLKLWALNLGSALLSSCSSSDSLAWVLCPKESIIYSLIPPMCDEGFLSKASFKVLSAVQLIVGGRLKENNFSALVDKLLQFEEEIVADASYLPESASKLSKEKKSAGLKVVKSIMDAVLSASLPLHLKCSSLYLLSQIENTEILEQLIPLGCSYLDGIKNLEFGHKLDPLPSTLLYYILLRFSSHDAAFLNLESGWKMFSRVMEMTEPVLQVTGETLAPQDLVVNYKVLQSISNSSKLLDVLDVLITRCVYSDNSLEASKLRRELKKINIDTYIILNLLTKYNPQPKLTSVKDARAKQMKRQNAPDMNSSQHEAELQNWQKLGLVVELIGVMDDLKEPWILIDSLCQHLKLSLELTTSSADILQQQILSVLYHLLQSSCNTLTKSDFVRHVTESVVVLNVQCIRQSVNPDTHRRALLILALVSNYFPDKVLHNIMAIFTFMGTSLLKRDDSYSFQVIHQTISSIVPTLIKEESSDPTCLLIKLAQVTQVFVDALPDLAEHRKLPLFSQLAETLGVSQYLWLVMAQIADAFVTRFLSKNIYTSSKTSGMKGLPPSIQFALVLYSQFPVVDQLQASCEVLNFACNLPDDKDTFKNVKPKDRHPSTLIINIEAHTSKQLRQLKHSCIGLLCQLLSSEQFVGQVYEMKLKEEDAEMTEIRSLFENLLEKALTYIKVVSTQELLNKGKPTGRFWNDMQRKLMDLVNAINSLLPPSSFVAIITNLLSTDSPLIRGRAMEILASKLQVDCKFFTDSDARHLTPFLDILKDISENGKETEENRQIALFTLQLLSKFLGPLVDPEFLMPVMGAAAGLLMLPDTTNIIQTQAILVIAECTSVLKVHCLPYLNQLVPSLLNILKEATSQGANNLDTRTVASATAVQKIVESIPEFLSKEQLESLVITNCYLISMYDENGQKDSRIKATRFSNVLEILIEKIEPRKIVEVLKKAYYEISSNGLLAVSTVMEILEKFIGLVKNEQLVMFKQGLIKLFRSALDSRKLKENTTLIDQSEQKVISALSRFLLRLNEDDNITIFSGFVTWAWNDQENYPGRLITFFRFSDTLVGQLKVLFIKAKLASYVFEYAAKTLERNNSTNHSNNTFGTGKESEEQACILINYTLDSLTKIFLYDSVQFTNEEKFNTIIAPLMDQLENTIGTDIDYATRTYDHLKPCVVKFATATGDDSLWKELNRQLLLRVKTDDNPKIILAALDIFESLIESLGEDYLQPLLADTMPHITEILESSDPEVEDKTKEIFKKMEDILGDNLRAYLDS